MPQAQAVTFWFTGLSGAGKTTLAHRLATDLKIAKRPFEILDGDSIRQHISAGLGFSKEDRQRNIRRIAWICQLLNHHGVDAIVAAISPYSEDRAYAREQLPRFIEIYCDANIETLIHRDPKGLYAKALRKEIKNFTGIDDPYEAPCQPEIHLHTSEQSIDESHRQIFHYLYQQQLIGKDLPVAVSDPKAL